MARIVSPTMPPGAHALGDVWYHTLSGLTFEWQLTAGGFGVWVQAIIAGPPVITAHAPVTSGTPLCTSSPLAPDNPDPCDLWYHTESGIFFIYYDDGDTRQWVTTQPTKVGDIIVVTGPAGGDLAGSYPNPTIRADVELIRPTIETLPAIDIDTLELVPAQWVNDKFNALPPPPVSLPPSGPAGGDLTGTYPNPLIKTNVALTGTPTAPTPTGGDASQRIANTSWTMGQLSQYLLDAVAAVTYAPIDSPTFTGDPKAPTPLTADNDTSLATTAFVRAAITSFSPPPDLTPYQLRSEKGTVSGYAGLDGSGKVPAAQLPAYVDDVLEFANLAAFPATGTVGIIYVALNTNRVYRWSGSAYIEISPSPGSTDSVPEGSVNFYYTDARAQAANVAALALKAPLASPVFTGNPTAPTPTAGDNDTSLATTAFVAAALAGGGASISVGTTPPGSPGANALWWNSELGALFIYYNDGNTTQWVPAAPAASANTGFRLLSRTTVATAQQFLDSVAWPADINDIQFAFSNVIPVTNAQDCVLQFFDSSGVIDNTAAHYAGAVTVAINTMAAVAPSTIGSAAGGGFSNGGMLDYPASTRRVGNITGITGRGWINNIRATAGQKTWGSNNTYASDDNAVQCNVVAQGYRVTPGLITGMRLVFGTGNIQPGAVLSVWGSP